MVYVPILKNKAGEMKAFAAESADPNVFAHVTAQQAYALLDAGRVAKAMAQWSELDRPKEFTGCGSRPGGSGRR